MLYLIYFQITNTVVCLLLLSQSMLLHFLMFTWDFHGSMLAFLWNCVFLRVTKKTWIKFDLAYYYKPLFYASELLLGFILSYFSTNLFSKNKIDIKIFDRLVILLYNVMLFHPDEVIMGTLNNNWTNDMYIHKNRNSNWCKTWMCTHMCMYYTCIWVVQYNFV